jgi:tetratricopeptide (TPR) repeat protein
LPAAEAGNAQRSLTIGEEIMRLNLLILIPLASFLGQAAAQQSELAIGRAFYTEGEFKKAAAHFELALTTNPGDAESCYWMGMSYQALADITAPLDRRYNAQARVYLTRATILAPDRPDYRRELFGFLLSSAGTSRVALRQAAAILRTVPESDPDYNDMCRRFDQERSVNASAGGRIGRLLLALPRAAYGIAELPASAFSNRRDAAPSVTLEP